MPIVPLPGSNENIYLFLIDDDLNAFRLHIGENNTTVESLLYKYWVTGFRVNSQPASLNLTVDYDPTKTSRQSTMRWDTGLNAFVSYATQEQELLLNGQAKAALNAIPALLAQMQVETMDYYDPAAEPARLSYLLGLAYELSGDPINAARVYYQLWRSAPGQPYGIMAREKLEGNLP